MRLDPNYKRDSPPVWPQALSTILRRGFLQAILRDNLQEACARADEENKYLIFDYVYALYNFAPESCWGSPDKVDQWIAQRKEERDAHPT